MRFLCFIKCKFVVMAEHKKNIGSYLLPLPIGCAPMGNGVGCL